ncbi:MAG: ATP-binding cassette domain-containing protein [Planctomycetes bacterium]|nr:ATP-binding cassette domain-containing protein [Planctomycetota bacterium]
MANALTLEHVTKRFGAVTAVEDLSLEVPSGCIYGFLGPNGAGKTTTIRMALGILYPDSGSLRVLGEESPEAVKDRLGYLPEEKGLYKKMKAAELLAYFGRLKGMDSRRARARALELLERFGLGDCLERRCEALSKGMGQKVQLAATLIHEPELLILDEPFSGLDPVNVELMREEVLEVKRRGRTIIFSTHIMEQAEQICDFVLLIDKGRKLLDGKLADIKAGSAKGIVLDYEGDGAALRDLPGVARLNDAGQRAEIFLSDGTEPQEILQRLVGRVKIRRFDTREASLHEIFVRAVGGKPNE